MKKKQTVDEQIWADVEKQKRAPGPNPWTVNGKLPHEDEIKQYISTGALHVSGAGRHPTKKQIAADEYVVAVEQGRKKGMIQGIALAINYMYRGNDEVAIWRAAGLTVQECIDNEVDEFDMEMILQHREELEQ